MSGSLTHVGPAIALALCAAVYRPVSADAPDGVVLHVDIDRGSGTVSLQWTGGDPGFEVYRSDDPTTVVAPGNKLGQTSDRTWYDTAPVGGILFYNIRPGADIAPPTVTSVAPSDLATQVPINSGVTVQFSEAIDCSTLSTASFILTGPSGGVPGLVSCAASSGSFTPLGALSYSQTYFVTVTTALRDLAGNAMAAEFHSSFTTAPGYSVGGTVSELDGTLDLTNNGIDPIAISSDGVFTFPHLLADGSAYLVEVQSQPMGQLCAIGMGQGHISGANVSSVTVTCRRVEIALNEVHARPATSPYGDTNGDGVRDAANDEFVEIISNEVSDVVDLSGWTLQTGATVPVPRFTFPNGTSLAPGGCSVVFGGGTPTGGFGGASVFVAEGLALTDAPATYTVALVAGAVTVDRFDYGPTTFGSSCTTTCASVTRQPEGTGPFVAHNTVSVSGSTGILWSPGVAADHAIPKLSPLLSTPRGGASNVNVLVWPTMQFNLFMNSADLDPAHITLFASTCAAAADPVADFTTFGPGVDSSQVLLVPSAPLAFSASYCLRAFSPRSAVGVVLDPATVQYEWTTRAAASARASTVVLSEFGGANLGSGAGGQDEFVELYNPTDVAVDISGWHVARRSGGGTQTCYANIPAGTILAAGTHYLIGGSGYNPANYGGVWADLQTAGTVLTGGTESVLLISSSGTCTGTSAVIDAVSVQLAGAPLTDTSPALLLPPLVAATGNGKSVERKACYNSTGDANITGMWGGHATKGNGERIGASNADWVLRTSPQPQDQSSPSETYGCP
jgi:hypothetical protein